MDTQELFQTLNNDTSKTWYTLKDISQLTNKPTERFEKILNKSDLFVRSAALSKKGEHLYTTRNEFQRKTSFGKRILGAFKNRID